MTESHVSAQQGPRGQTGPVVSRVPHLLGAFTRRGLR